MCTVSYIPLSDQHYILGSNRDEMKTRPKARKPEVKDGGLWIAPTDTSAGGTWIGVNKHGLGFTIINNYQAVPPEESLKKKAKSRGLIIPSLADSENLQSVTGKMQALNPSDYNPFELIAVQHSPSKIIRWNWDGYKFEKIIEQVKPQIFISAGRDIEEITEYRQRIFDEFLSKTKSPKLRDVQQFHEHQHPDSGKLSVAMMQDLVQSVSGCVAEITNKSATITYCEGRPSPEKPWLSFRLP